jgi:hypothetical protein
MKKGPRDTNYPSSRMKWGVFDGSNGQTFHGELLECFQIDDDGWILTTFWDVYGCIYFISLMLIIISIIHPDGRGRWGNASIWVYIFS